jgi:SnoaL-like domain
MLELAEITARLEIYEALMKYVRGIDRRDATVLAAAYWPDAIDSRSYNDGRTAAPALAQRAVDGFGDLPEFSQHHMTNVIYNIDISRPAWPTWSPTSSASAKIQRSSDVVSRMFNGTTMARSAKLARTTRITSRLFSHR